MVTNVQSASGHQVTPRMLRSIRPTRATDRSGSTISARVAAGSGAGRQPARVRLSGRTGRPGSPGRASARGSRRGPAAGPAPARSGKSPDCASPSRRPAAAAAACGCRLPRLVASRSVRRAFPRAQRPTGASEDLTAVIQGYASPLRKEAAGIPQKKKLRKTALAGSRTGLPVGSDRARD